MSMRAKKDPVFKIIIGYLIERFDQLTDRRTGKNSSIQMRDIGLTAFSTFFLQCPSFRQSQQLMTRRHSEANAKNLFGIQKIPSDNHIRSILDAVPYSDIFPVYDAVLNQLEEVDILAKYSCLDDQLLIAADGVHYFSSKAISCPKCQTRHHGDGTVTYAHSMVATALVHPDRSEVIPLKPEFITPQDGHAKQDCERTAIKRWLSAHGPGYARLGVTMLGDDLYACHPVCTDTLAQGMHFIFTCKRDSHKTLYEWVDPFEGSDQMHTHKEKIKIKGKIHTYHCRYLNDVPIRDGDDALRVNWCGVEVFDHKNRQVFSSAYITDHRLTEERILPIIRAGRSRWKIENEHNNTLKNHGYCFKHNYGHGQKYLSNTLATLILLSFLYHTVLKLLDERYRIARKADSRVAFFNHMKTLMGSLLFSSWDTLMEFMVQSLGPRPIDSS